MRRRMQWSSRTSTIIISLLLLLIPITIVHGFINNEEKEEIYSDNNGDNKMMSLELVHRNHPRFLDKNGVLDQLQTMKGFIQRDTIRHKRMNQRWGLYTNFNNNRRRNYETFEMPMESGRDYGLGEYFVEVEVGTPGQKFWVVADSGNDFTWFNCLHRNRNRTRRRRSSSSSTSIVRHKRRSRSRSKTRRTRTKSKKPCRNGVFCPHRSSSFQSVKCSSHKCKVDLSDLFSLTYCPRPSDPCLYDFSYVDGSSVKGFFGTDKITVNLTNGKKGKLEDLTIGCTRSILNGITFNEDTGGVLGLGYAKDSFVDKAAIEYGGKFSYCLVDHLSHRNLSSYLIFGNQNFKLLREMKKTELLIVPPLYGVNLVGISIGGQMLEIPPQVWNFSSNGGTVIDSGTTLTQLVDLAYGPVIDALNKSLTKTVKMVSGDFGVLDFCFNGEGFDEGLVPRLVFHFNGGSSFKPPVKSYIIDVAPKVKCIGIVEAPGPGTSVIGNIMQQNHVWEFDLSHNTVGFAPSTCNY